MGLDAADTAYQYDARDRLTAEGPDVDGDANKLPDPATATAYGYDDNGSMTAKGADDAYTWDQRGRMASATVGGVTTAYGYDGQGQRVSEQVGSGPATVYVNDRQNPSGYPQVLEEKTGAATPVTAPATTSYVRAAQVTGQSDATGTAGGVARFVRDGHGSNRGLVNAVGQLVERYDYQAYGEPAAFAAVNLATGVATAITEAGGRRRCTCSAGTPSLTRPAGCTTTTPGGGRMGGSSALIRSMLPSTTHCNCISIFMLVGIQKAR